jgi:sigma-B regulation protein RsbU (phosphoserine phosphatase)
MTSSIARAASLVITGQDRPVLQFPLHSNRLLIGRDAASDLRLDANTISRRHAEMFLDPFGRWWIRDLASRNGIYLGERRIDERALQHGDELQLGEFIIRFDSPTPDAPSGKTISTLHTTDDAGQLVSLHDVEPPRLSAQHLSTLIEFGRTLLETDNDTDRLELLCRLLLRPEFGGNFALALRCAEASDAQVLCGPFRASESGSEPYISRRLVQSARQNGRPTLANNRATGPDVVRMTVYSPATSATAIACPLDAAQVGPMLYVGFSEAHATAEWLAIASLAAEQFKAAEASWAARRQAQAHAVIELELEQATRLQKELIPKHFAAPGIELEITFRPCRWVGGDYVGARVLNDGRVLLAIADVCGKGMPAALIASSVHTMLFATARTGACLSEVINALNSYICETVGFQRFVTMACIVLDPATGRFEYANAGHPPPLITRPGQQSRRLPAGENLPLGVDSTSINCRDDRLESDELLTIYTDGVSELELSDGRLLGADGLAAKLADLCAEPGCALSALAQDLTTHLDQLQQGRLAHDDLTLMLARRV